MALYLGRCKFPRIALAGGSAISRNGSTPGPWLELTGQRRAVNPPPDRRLGTRERVGRRIWRPQRGFPPAFEGRKPGQLGRTQPRAKGAR